MTDQFTWTQEYRRTWEEENVTGDTRRTAQLSTAPRFRRSLARHLLVVVDVSAAIERPDFVPTVRQQVASALPQFVQRFKAANPLSAISFAACGAVCVRRARAVAGEAAEFLNTVGDGPFSLVNALQTAVALLEASRHARECLIITASIGTRDEEPLSGTAAQLRRLGIKTSFISVCGEVTVFKQVAGQTGGRFVVPVDSDHFHELLSAFAEPLESVETTNALLPLGFPVPLSGCAVCVCHLQLQERPYECPQCQAVVCEPPGECFICGLQLAAAADIVRTGCYQMKPPEIRDVRAGVAEGADAAEGAGEGEGVADGVASECRLCAQPSVKACAVCAAPYCEACTVYVVDELGFCPFCP